MATFCFDIDGTLCEQVMTDYSLAEPFQNRIDKVNSLYDDGHRIILFSARGSVSGRDWRQPTLTQLSDWGVRYHELILGKPHADVYIDDKAIHSEEFDW